MSTTTTGSEVLDGLEQAAREVASTVLPSVVGIGRNSRGSGVVVAPNRVLTNAHNLRDRTTQVTFADGRSAQGAVVGADTWGDLVVLEVDTAEAPSITWSDDAPIAGAVIFAAARGLRGERISFGIVSGTGRTFRGPKGRPVDGAIEHTAPLARGSSGGPLVDRRGSVVGLNTHRLGDGFYLALAAGADLQARVADLVAGRSATRLTLGVAVASAHVARRLRASVGLPERDGLLVRGVEGSSPGARAGITAGDLLVRAADRDLATPDDLFTVLDGHDASTPLVIALVRGADEITVSVSFDEDAPTQEGTA
jgi:S1-C subfamily serine protease